MPRWPKLNPNLDSKALEDEFALVREACHKFDLESFREGHLTPVFFGSALKNFGVGDLWRAWAPSRRRRARSNRICAVSTPKSRR